MSNPKIKFIDALEILDSRGNPTLRVTIQTDNGLQAHASVPSGASTGEHEAMELRDGDKKRYFGKGVLKAIKNIKEKIAPLLTGESPLDQSMLDERMIREDGTKNKRRLGANAILGASLALTKLGSQVVSLPLYRYLGGLSGDLLPCPMMNILNGGVHADNGLAFQEFMIRPVGAPTFAEAVRFGVEIFQTLKERLKTKGHSTAVGDEGGFAPRLKNTEEALDYILLAIQKAGYRAGEQISLALDCAASTFYDSHKKKYIDKEKERSSEEQIGYLQELVGKYPIDSIEDGLAENDWENWKKLTTSLGKKIQIVGDDIFVTNSVFLQQGIEQGVANAILIKPNQIGTVTETLNCIELAHANRYATVISHRSGETEETFISDLAVATRSGQIKTGSLCRSERIVKYNRLLEIEKELLSFNQT